MALALYDRSSREAELDWSEHWVYQTVAALCHRADARGHAEFLAKLLSQVKPEEDRAPENERISAARLLGALGVLAPLDSLIAALDDPSLRVRAAVRRALVEIGEPAGEELAARLPDFGDRACREALATLRGILDSPRTSPAFRWLAYCLARGVLKKSSPPAPEDVAVEAARLLGFFGLDDEDRGLVERFPGLGHRLLVTAYVSRAPDDAEIPSESLRGDLADNLVKFFCLPQLPAELREESVQADLSFDGLRVFFEAFGVFHRSPGGTGPTPMELLTTVRAHLRPELVPGWQRTNERRFLDLVRGLTKRRGRAVPFRPPSSEGDWRGWVRLVWTRAFSGILKVRPAPAHSPGISFRRIDR